jgi:hypothetical protein
MTARKAGTITVGKRGNVGEREQFRLVTTSGSRMSSKDDDTWMEKSLA